MAALAHGLPLVLVPIAADQPENSRRCASLGVAHVLNEDTLNPIVARAAVRDVLDNPSYRRNAERLRAEIEGLPSPEQAVTFLERFVAGLNPALDQSSSYELSPLCSERGIAIVLTGAETPAELDENAANMQVPIPTDLWKALKQAGLLHPEAPTPA